MYQGAKNAFKNAVLFGFFQSAKTCNLRALGAITISNVLLSDAYYTK